LLAAGCGTSKEAKEKPLFSRGWIGGQVRVVNNFPKSMVPRPKKAILLTELMTNTPAAAAGLRAGDLILALDHQPVYSLRDFREQVDKLPPGTSLPVTTYRDGQILDSNIVAGRESYRKGGLFSIYFPVVAYGWNFWPHGDYPGLSLVALGYQNNRLRRTELDSVSRQYDLKCNPKDTPYMDDYRIWLGILELSKGKQIASQELVNAAK
jgi:membrane-associated protease RseP (regulator of RpoE activity)